MPEMSSSISAPENGCVSTEDLKVRKSLKSAVIPDDDRMKIKLKISKAEIADIGKTKKESSGSEKKGKISGKPELNNGDDVAGEEPDLKSSKIVDPKMRLRSQKEAEEENFESEESEDKKKKKDVVKEEEEKPWKKRIKTIKYFGDEGYGRRDESARKRSRKNESDASEAEKVKEVVEDFTNINKESFCWTCHKAGSVVKCDTCPRVFHLKCVSLSKDPSKDWICPECSLVLHAEKFSTRSEAMKSVSLDQLCTLLSFAIDRMKNVPESQAFWKPVDPKEVPNYDKYITNPMDLNLLEKNMKAKMYGSPQAFLADAKWLLHNSIIFNSTQSPLTSTARFLVKICKQEMAEIENCPDCYLNAHTKDDWFIEVCRKPHILIWARLKGFPFWPAKAMSTNLKTQQVDARFFGAHDKAWVPVKECFLYSKNNPQVLGKKRADLDDAFLEAEGYIKKIRQKYGSFCYAPDKTPFMPEMYDKQLQSMIPNYKEEKPVKKRRRGDPEVNENGVVEKPCQNGRKLDSDAPAPNKLKIKRSTIEETAKVDGLSIVEANDYVTEEKISGEDQVSPEDEIARSLELFDTHKKVEGETLDENSTDLDEDESIHIPEHGYSRNAEVANEEQSPKETENKCENTEEVEITEENTCPKAVDETEKKEEPQSTENIEVLKVTESNKDISEKECVAESSDESKSKEEIPAEVVSSATDVEQFEVSSTSADSTISKNVDSTEPVEDNQEKNLEVSEEQAQPETSTKNQPSSSQDSDKSVKEKPVNSEQPKATEEKSSKSFDNLTCDEKEKILTEAKLLANIDEMTAQGKEKVLNDLGLDASQVDIREIAQENRQILESLNVQCQSEKKGFEEISIKSEDFEQYLIEENNQEEVYQEEPEQLHPKCGSIKVRDFESLSKSKSSSPSPGKSNEPMLKIMDVHSLKQSIKDSKMKRKRSLEDSVQAKKQQLDPVIKVIKLDSCDSSVEKLNRKLRLSDEVSLLMVDGEKKVNVNVECVETEPHKTPKKPKPPRARKSMPNKAKSADVPKNINVISVDTENSTAQKNLLKSLCLEEKKPDDSNKKTFLLTPNEKGGKNIDGKSDLGSKKQLKEVTIEAIKDTGKVEQNKEGIVPAQKNLAVVANSHLIVTNSGPAIVTNQSNQPNLALAQNNLGQLSLVHLSNLTSGIQTNFINLTNETIGFNNSIGTLYAAPGFSTEFPNSNAGTGSVIITPSPVLNTGNTKGGKPNEKVPVNRMSNNKPNAGISVKSPASLGLVTPPTNKLPSTVTSSGDGIPIVGEVGSVTAELNKHSIKMAEYMRATIEDLLRELSNQGSLEAKYKLLSIEMEKLQWRHQQEIMELKHHSERSMMELRSSLESEKQKCLGELKAQLESQHQKVISETKRKQWCANCGKEALFYCCWNTSYCDYPCQQQHWPGHMSTCAQLGNNVTIGSTPGSQLQNKNSGMKYQNSNYVPVMSRAEGGSGGNSGIGGGSHSGGAFAANRAIPTVQAQSSHSRRTSDAPGPQLPVNITIRPHYYM